MQDAKTQEVVTQVNEANQRELNQMVELGTGAAKESGPRTAPPIAMSSRTDVLQIDEHRRNARAPLIVVRFDRRIYRLRPWFHDFALLGIRTMFPDVLTGLAWWKAVLLGRSTVGISDPERDRRLQNQRCKEPVIIDYCRRGLDHVTGPDPSCLDLFCSDGYYAFHLKRLHAGARVLGIDKNARDVARATAMACVLFPHDDVRFREADVATFCDRSIRDGTRFDFVLCVGGLYHLGDPHGLLERLRPLVTGALVIQSVVTLETESSDYLEVPAKHWGRGSRFTHEALKRWLMTSGFRVELETRNELTGNDRPQDRGSSYFLCQPR